MVTPSNALKPEPPTETTILTLAYKSIQEEFKRINILLSLKSKSIPQSKLGSYIEDLIKNFFNDQMEIIDGFLVDLSKTNTPEEIDRAWDAYVRLKTDLIPHLSKDLLALIGGAYLMDEKLDVIQPQDEHGLPLQSFSELATEMIKELTKGWESVLIVGEEDWSYSKSEIIRLRFPACDVWHLPFTVHEYFYLRAQSDMKAPDMFKRELIEMAKGIDPLQEKWIKPANEECYLAEIRQLWNDYETIKTDPQKWEEYFKALVADPQKWSAYQERVKELGNLQRAYISHLFADAFATYYIGPAYIHALLNLEFIPAEKYHMPPEKPRILERYVIALEILSWMNKELTGDVRDDASLFRRELGEQGFPKLWSLALRSAGITADPYEEIKTRLSGWIKLFKDILREKTYFGAWKSTYENWRTAQKIEAILPKADLKLSLEPSHWAVVNAAWSARWLYPSFEPFIHDNALWLLNLNDEKKAWYDAPAPSLGGEVDKKTGRVAGQTWDRQAAIAEITNFLAIFIIGKNFSIESNPILRWSPMVASGNFSLDPAIISALVSSPKLLENYQKLYSGT